MPTDRERIAAALKWIKENFDTSSGCAIHQKRCWLQGESPLCDCWVDTLREILTRD